MRQNECVNADVQAQQSQERSLQRHSKPVLSVAGLGSVG